MKHTILTLVIFISLAACSSKPDKKVDKMAQAYPPVLEMDTQVARINTMIQSNENLDQGKKNDLIALVNEQADKITEVKKKQSQLRAVLVNQLLESSDGSKSKAIATSKELEALNKENIKGLNDFIIKFKTISGERALEHEQIGHAMGTMHFM